MLALRRAERQGPRAKGQRAELHDRAGRRPSALGPLEVTHRPSNTAPCCRRSEASPRQVIQDSDSGRTNNPRKLGSLAAKGSSYKGFSRIATGSGLGCWRKPQQACARRQDSGLEVGTDRAYDALYGASDPGLAKALGLAWDAGAVTTGPVTVQLVLSLGIGIAAAAGKGESGLSGFGIVTLSRRGW